MTRDEYRRACSIRRVGNRIEERTTDERGAETWLLKQVCNPKLERNCPSSATGINAAKRAIREARGDSNRPYSYNV